MPYQVPLHEGPVMCPYCNVEANYVDSAIIYNGVSFGEIYLCSRYPDHCDARSAAMGEGRPIGTLARAELRALRKVCHQYFDTLWKGTNPTMRRGEAYASLQNLMEIQDPREAHIGQFDEDRCIEFLKRWTKKHLIRGESP